MTYILTPVFKKSKRFHFSSFFHFFHCSYDSTSSIGSGGSMGPGNAGGRHASGGRGGVSGRGNRDNQQSHHGGGSAPFNPYMHNAPGGSTNPNLHHSSAGTNGTNHFNPQVERRSNDRTMIYSSSQVNSTTTIYIFVCGSVLICYFQ